MPIWRCPHCGTPQAESSRCWVCRRSTTSCATCRHYRRGIAGGLGMCGLDPRHTALLGTEMRACWAAPAPVVDTPSPHAAPVERAAPHADAATARRTFVPVEELERAADRGSPSSPQPAAAPVTAPRATAPGPDRGGWSLWGDAEL